MRRRAAPLFFLVLLLVAAGVFRALHLPASIFPSVTFPIVKVIADSGEEPAARMMPSVTRPLEEAILRVPGISRVVSTTSRGSTEIAAEFAWGSDMKNALARVQAESERIRPELPAGTRISVAWMNTSIFPILGYALVSDSRDLSDLTDLATYTLKPELMRIPGVSEVQIQGDRQREFQIRLDPGALAGRKLSPSDVIDAIRKNDQVLSAGLLEKNHELYLSLVDGRAEGREEIGKLSVPAKGEGVPARLDQLGTVGVGEAVSYVRTTAQGRPAVLVNIVQQPSANTVQIAKAIQKLLHDRPDLVPKGVSWIPFYDQAAFVADSVNGARDAILIGVGLAGIVLFLFLRSFRLTLFAILLIPVCVAITFLGLAAAGQTLNLMTLGGIAAAIGLIADDAIVVVEDLERGGSGGSRWSDVLAPLAGSSLSTIVIFLPFAMLTGIVGAFFRPLALTMALALGVSFLLAGFVLPAAVGAIASGARRPQKDMPRLRRTVAFSVRHPLLALGAFLLLLAAGFFFYQALDTDFLPHMDEGSIILDYWTPAGTSLTDTDVMLASVERVILATPGVEAYSRRTGTQLGFFITEPNRGDYVIKLKPARGRKDVDEIIDEMRRRIAAIAPAVHTDFGQLLEDNIGDLTGGVPQPIDVRISGQDQTVLQQKAALAARIISGVKGVEDVFDGIVIAGPPLTLKVHPEEASRAGLSTEDLHEAVESALVGTVAGDVRIGERVYGLRVFEGRPANLDDLPIRTESGAYLPLSHFARITTGAPEAEIDRENLQTYLGVTARLSGRSLGSAVSEIRGKLDRDLHLQPGMSIRFGGLYEQQQSSFKGLLAVLLAGLVLVAVVLLFEFGDWRAPLLTALISVAVLASVFGFLLLTGMAFNISSFVGAIMMVGIVGEKSVFFIHDAREELRGGASPEEAWSKAAVRRFRAVAMTTLAAVFALAPLALGLGAGAQLQQPLAIAVIGGFFLSGLIVLLILPSLFAWLDPKGKLGAVTRPE